MTESLQSQYQALGELKALDEKIHWVERDVERIPAEISKLESGLGQAREALGQAEQEVDRIRTQLRGAEHQLKEKEDALFKAEGKLMEVKTNVEYQAALKENAEQKKAKGALEEAVLEALTEVEKQNALLSSVKSEFKAHELQTTSQTGQLRTEHEKLVKQLESLLADRQSLMGRLAAETAALYRKALNAGRYPAIALVESGRCKGCSLQLLPQAYNEILGRTAIHRCSHCSRLLLATPQGSGDPTNEAAHTG